MNHNDTRIKTEHNGINTNRIISFSDGVIAVIITILVLEIKVPTGSQLADLRPILPMLLAYLLSFRQIGTYWNNHHHLLALAHKASAQLMWTNLNFLFCVSLIPFTTAWLGMHYTAVWPVALYGAVSLLGGAAYNRLQQVVLAVYPQVVVQKTRFGKDVKGKLSLTCYALGIAFAFVDTWISLALYVAVAAIWFVPERRVEEISADQ